MDESINQLKREIERLKERLNTANRKKANLQMAVTLIKKIASVSGMDDVASQILSILISAIGGSNISIYYQVEDRWRYVDALGKSEWLESVDDELVWKSIEEKSFQKRLESTESKLTIPGFPKTYETWVYPLEFMHSYFGAIRLKGMAIEHAHYRENIDPFIQYSSIILFHEISNVKKLQAAYKSVSLAKDELQRSKEQYELAMNFSNDGIFDWNLETNEIYFSPVWKSLLGYEEDEIKNDFSEWERLTKSGHVQESWTMLNEVLTGHRDRFEKELQMRHKDGHWVDILSRANIIFNEHGKGVRVVGTHIDISKMKRLEKEIRESELKYRSILEASKDPTYICSEDYRIEYMNPAMVDWLGKDSTGECCFKAVHNMDQACSWCSFDAVRKHQSESIEYVSPRDKKRYMISSSPILHEDDTVSKMTVFSDITELFEMKIRLHQAQKMESIGNLAGGIAHDFNNILTSILGFTELAIDEIEPGTSLDDCLQEVYVAGKRAKDLVGQILTFARRSEEKMKPIQADAIISETLNFIRSSIPASIEIRRNINSSSIIMGNQTQLHQVMMNLCTNAAKAMEEKGGILDVCLEDITIGEGSSEPAKDLIPGEYIQITISDTGFGISDDIIDLIFEPYFTTKKMGEGTGMGLAVVHGIVESYGGKIDVKSTMGSGTTFIVYLPVTRKRDSNSMIDTGQLPTGTERILFVDDEESIVRMNSRGLARLGYSVTVQTSSQDALKLFQSKPYDFDLVITDMTMPIMAGDVLARHVLAVRPEIPIIMCTGYSQKMTEEYAQEIGIKTLINKPVGKTDLAKIIRETLDGSR